MKISKSKIGFLAKIVTYGFGLAILSNGTSNLAIAQSFQFNEGVSAIVNDVPITSFDVRQRVRYLFARQNITQPTDEIISQAATQALDALINERLQLQEAKRFKLNISDAEVDRIIEGRVKANGGTLQQLYSDLNASGLSVASYRDTVRAEVAWQRIVVGRFGSRVKVSPDRVKEAVSRIQASANKTQYSVSEIFIESPTPEEDAQTLKGAQTLVQKLRAGDSFKTTAEIYSYAPSAATGGNIGWVLAGELRPEVAAVVDKVEIGQVSDPIKVQGGYMIIGVAGKHEAKDLTTTYTLKQISKNLSANSDDATTRKIQAQLLASKSQVKGNCANIERVAKANGLSANNLGSIEDKDLTPELLTAISNLPQGGSTEIMRTKNGLNITFMCEKVISGEDIPTAEQIEDNLHDQELNLIARRYLRDIRRDAAIVKR